MHIPVMSPYDLCSKACGFCCLLFHRAVQGNRNGELPNISSIRVWSVPSIAVTMSLDDVELTTDDELVTIEKGTDDMDIYLREGIQQSRRAEVVHELVNHFKETIGFDEKLTALIFLVLSVPIHSIPGILDKHNIPLPTGSNDAGSSNETENLEDDKTLTEEGGTHSDSLLGSHNSRGGDTSRWEDSSTSSGTLSTPSTESGAGSDTERRGGSTLEPRATTHHTTHPTPLQESIPSHQPRSESIIQRASDFRLCNAEAAAPVQHRSDSGATPSRSALPIGSSATGINADQSELSSPSRALLGTAKSYPSSFGVGDGTGGGYSSVLPSRESSSATTNCGRVDDTSEIRAREIGFLGELFVRTYSQPLLEIINLVHT
jgi:hypothetical protein